MSTVNHVMDIKTDAPSLDELKQLRLFQDVDIDTTRKLLDQCPIRYLKKNEVLVNVGKTNSALYLLISGKLSVYLPGRKESPVADLEVGESVGEISVIDRQPASANVVATAPSRLIEIDEDLLWRIAKQSHGVALNLLAILSKRLRHGNLVIDEIQQKMQAIEQDALIDPLTGLYNRRWLNSMLERQIQRADQDHQPLSVIMIDIDHFKLYNDTYGHQAGDQALRKVSDVITQYLRPNDTIARYGGEEFLALLPNTALDRAREVAERLRLVVKSISIPGSSDEQLPAVTLSIGIAQHRNNRGSSELVDTADKALYCAKREGRDRVCASLE